MKQIIQLIFRLIKAALLFALANSYSLMAMGMPIFFLAGMLLLFLWLNIVPSLLNGKFAAKRLRICADGCELLRLFLLSTSASVIYSIAGFGGGFPCGSIVEEPIFWIVNTLIIILTECILFWNGIIRIYLTSGQLGIRWRVLGIICGWIPVIHLAVLMFLIHTAEREVRFEHGKICENRNRKQLQVCRTKYPLLLVHGVFFRDYRYLNYWGRIPRELEENGALVFYGNHQSAASVMESAKELSVRIRQIVEETECEKVNIIAHSKGGLDCRYAVSMLGMDSYVASLTTINTPHRGCEFADYLLCKISQRRQEAVAHTYNGALRRFGDANPDFLAAVYDLTASACRQRNEMVQDVPGVYYQSVGSKLNRASGGRFPLNFTYQLVRYFDGRNDGLVGEQSFPWGENYRFLTTEGKRGISHGDMIDLNRENFEGFDAREFYVQLVHGLKERGF